MEKHTPTPWRYLPSLSSEHDQSCGYAYPYLLYSGSKFIGQIAVDQHDSEADGEHDAALIVRAVNAHDELVATLDRIAVNAEQMAADQEQSASSRRTWRICADDARSALAKASA